MAHNFSTGLAPSVCVCLASRPAVSRSILLIVAMGAYYIVAALEVWKWADRVVGASRVPWPDWAWGLGAGASLLWIISAGFASGETCSEERVVL